MSNGDDKKYLPASLAQNPASTPLSGQDYEDRERQLVENILSVFYQVVPSNYVSQITGPFYTLQFQAAAEQIAKIQIELQEAFYDADFDITRPEFLYQIMGSLVFPDQKDGIPQIDGDVSYRTFLRRMILLLLQGSTNPTLEDGLRLLTDADIDVIEMGIEARDTEGSAWGFDQQHEIEVNVSADDGQSFPDNPFVLQENARLVLEALKPAHVLYKFRFLFKEVFEAIFEDEYAWTLDIYKYEDFRKYCLGYKEITSSAGETLTDRSLFRDPSRSFRKVSPRNTLTITSGVNAGAWTVKEVLTYPVGDDATPRAYMTAPSFLGGLAIIQGGVIIDQGGIDFAGAVEGEILTFLDGPNAGGYQLETLVGGNGGPVGSITPGLVPYLKVTPFPSIVRLDRRMPQAATGQAYTLEVDRLGIQKPRIVLLEDHSAEFTL